MKHSVLVLSFHRSEMWRASLKVLYKFSCLWYPSCLWPVLMHSSWYYHFSLFVLLFTVDSLSCGQATACAQLKCFKMNITKCKFCPSIVTASCVITISGRTTSYLSKNFLSPLGCDFFVWILVGVWLLLPGFFLSSSSSPSSFVPSATSSSTLGVVEVTEATEGHRMNGIDEVHSNQKYQPGPNSYLGKVIKT